MTTNSTTVEKPEESIADSERADHASDAFIIGVDQQGREHYHSLIRDCITVCNDGTHKHTEPLDGRPLSDWMAFIQQEFGGWTENNTFTSRSGGEHR